MREPATLSITEISTALAAGYALTVDAVVFLPLGDDPTAWVYRVAAAHGQSYLLKLKRGKPAAASLSIPRYLHTHGLPEVVAPLPTPTGTSTYSPGEFTFTLYPWIEGETGMAQELSAEQWVAFGALLERLHSTQLPADLLSQLSRETFAPATVANVHSLDRLVAQADYADTDMYQVELAAFWQSRRTEIASIVQRMTALDAQLRAAPPSMVLCHADIHTANVLVRPTGKLAVVDWDGLLMAPKERDLMFVMARAVVQHTTERHFFQGYGTVIVNPVAFAYYRYAWVVQEFADYGSRIFLAEETGTTTKEMALAEFRRLFAPGDVVDVARATEVDI